MDLIKRFGETDYVQALESWTWIDLGDKSPLFTSLFGDVFFRAPDGFWFLDTIEGTLTKPWQRREDVEAVLASRDGQEQFLLASLPNAAHGTGLELAAREVYDFKTPPMLGGVQEPDNLAAMDFTVGLNLCGQIHAQVRNLPPGTPLGEIKITSP